MEILKGNREKGFTELTSFAAKGASFNRIRLSSGSEPSATPPEDIFLLMIDAGDDELVQLQLTEDEAIMLKMAMNTEGSWIYPER